MLVVDTVGFAPGVLSPPVVHSDRLHVVERFWLDPAGPTLMRSYTAEDPVYFVGTYTGSDMLPPADVPYSPDECKGELTFIDCSNRSLPRPRRRLLRSLGGSSGIEPRNRSQTRSTACPTPSAWAQWAQQYM